MILSGNEMLDAILGLLSTGPMTVQDIREKVECGELEAVRAINLLVAIGLIVFDQGVARLEETVEDLLKQIC